METRKVKKKRLNVARTLVFVLFIYIIVCFGMYIYKEPVKHYNITGNEVISDIEIIRSLKLEDYPSFISINTKNLEKTLVKDKLVKSADVSYGWNFKLNIKIEYVAVYCPVHSAGCSSSLYSGVLVKLYD